MNKNLKNLREEMESAYVDWAVDNPSDNKLKAKFFRLQAEYKKVKGKLVWEGE